MGNDNGQDAAPERGKVSLETAQQIAKDMLKGDTRAADAPGSKATSDRRDDKGR